MKVTRAKIVVFKENIGFSRVEKSSQETDKQLFKGEREIQKQAKSGYIFRNTKTGGID